MSQKPGKGRRRLLFLRYSPGSTPAWVGSEKKQFNLKVVQGKWTRELSCWNLIRDPPNYYYLPSRKVKWLPQPKELREVGRIGSPEGEGLQTFQILSLKLLEVIFLKNANIIGTEDCKAENVAKKRACVHPEIWQSGNISTYSGERWNPCIPIFFLITVFPNRKLCENKDPIPYHTDKANFPAPESWSMLLDIIKGVKQRECCSIGPLSCHLLPASARFNSTSDICLF